MSNFNYKDILQSSVACASLAEWVIAMDMYAKISKEVEPKRKRVAAAEADLRAVTEQLKKKQQQLHQVEVKIKELQESYDHQVAEKKKLEISIMQTQSRLKRASKLTTALADEQIRWKESINEFREQMKTVTGNVFVSSACVAYYGAFPSSYRQEVFRLIFNYSMKTIFDLFSLLKIGLPDVKNTVSPSRIIRRLSMYLPMLIQFDNGLHKVYHEMILVLKMLYWLPKDVVGLCKKRFS
jgi:regulator of replication initiation timing